MKLTHIFIYILAYLFTYSYSFAAQDSILRKTDSLSYESQRQRVNKLLDERTTKFGEYSASLEKKTGVFGLFKTKGDMQKSIDILRALVLNDNNIFIETRKLLDLKDAQTERYQQLASQYDNQVSAYMKTITKLQDENEKLREELNSEQKDDTSNTTLLYFAILAVVVLSILLFSQYKKRKGEKLTE